MRLVVGVIGHVDHGKTALVRALTGMETDRLAEEKRRGISIALGFAHLTVPEPAGNVTIDLIDMPGHERFIRTMVSGATGIDAALLVVAANEGIKPQTVEHLDIAALLGQRRVIVAISKTDLVAPDAAEAVGRAAAQFVRGVGLTVSATVLTCAQTGAGLDGLRSALAEAVPDARGEDGFAYLPVDRAFSVPGHGTVVTGTLRRGSLAVSDAMTILPQGRLVRLRGLQVHGSRVASALPGQRVAANLRDVSPDEIARGAALAPPGLLAPSEWLTVRLRAVDSAPPIPTGARLLLLFGTQEVEARLRLLDCDELPPGGVAFAQLRCAMPACVPARERFILRRASPARTVAGGSVIDPAATRLRRHAPAVLARLAALADAAAGEIVHREMTEAGAAGVSLARLAGIAGLSEARAAEEVLRAKGVLGRGRMAVAHAEYDRILAAIPRALGADETPLDHLAASLPWAGREVLEDAVADLLRRGTILRAAGGLRRAAPQRDRDRAEQEATRAAQIADALRRGFLTPPDPAALAPDPPTRRLVERLVREGVVVRATDRVQKRDILFHHDAIEAAKRRLAPLLAGQDGMLVGEAGAALGISRKYCVPLLEYFDAIRFTRRVADRRVLAGREKDRLGSPSPCGRG
jgi:selenocysteine-specific elongation factor